MIVDVDGTIVVGERKPFSLLVMLKGASTQQNRPLKFTFALNCANVAKRHHPIYARGEAQMHNLIPDYSCSPGSDD